MTRETKIGLLVGLAFIIVIGILLSDHMSATSEPPQAAFAGAGSNVREGVAAPLAGSTPAAPPAPTRIDGPRSPVPTQSDLNPPKPPVGIVQVGPGAVESPVSIHGHFVPAAPQDVDPGTGTAQVARGQGPVDRGGAVADRGNVVTPPLPPAPDRTINELVLRNPDELVPVGSTNGGQRAAAPVDPSAPRHYAAQPGDTVSKLAGRFYGANTKTNRDLIIAANPPLQAEGNPVIVGKVYVLPSAGLLATAPGVAPTAPATGAPTAAPVVVARAPAAAAPGPAAANANYYTVKENDSLWKIAESELGTGNAWTTIRDLNADVLKGGETVTPNMRLKLPPKSVASAAGN